MGKGPTQMTKRILAVLSLAIVVAAIAAGCTDGPASDAPEVTLDGAGATFPAPLYDLWQGTYTVEIEPNTHINYNALGSGAGITQIIAQQVDFAGTDAPMNDAERANASGILHIPSTLGGVVIIYNIPRHSGELKVDSSSLAKIFTGELRDWNDPALVALNPSLATVDHNITPVHRSDGSGTTFVFTSYLSKTQPTTWAAKGGKNWPNNIGIGGNGNSGVSSAVQQNTYSIGYVELAFASKSTTRLTLAVVKNHDGRFVTASPDTIKAAAVGLTSIPAADASWRSVEVLDQAGADSYPISSMTYLLLYKTQADHDKGTALVDFIWWAIHDGQAMCAPNGYAPLPATVVTANEVALRSVKDSDGEQLHP